eukprot:7717417-Alexandrium_andersonii.AAC.1
MMWSGAPMFSSRKATAAQRPVNSRVAAAAPGATLPHGGGARAQQRWASIGGRIRNRCGPRAARQWNCR